MEYVYQCPKRTRAVYLDAIDVFLEQMDDAARKVGVEDWESYEEEALETKKRLIPAVDLGPAMLMNYWQEYGPEREWEVIHTEQPFHINVPHPSASRSDALVVYAGTWDMLAWHRPTRRYWLWDHKTAAKIEPPEYLDLDDQAGSYLWVAKEVLLHKGLLEKRDRISGIVFNIARKAMPDERSTNNFGEALNKDGTISKRQPSPRFMRYEAVRTHYNQVQQARRVQQEAVVMQQIIEGKLPIIKNTTHECPRCILFDLCTAHEDGEDWEYLQEHQYTVRDLYKDHREAMQRDGIEL